jgi:hypothetical protein
MMGLSNRCRDVKHKCAKSLGFVLQAVPGDAEAAVS